MGGDPELTAREAATVAAAREAAAHAYAPYSRFPVGAALMFEDGTIVSGSNVENASYGLSLCAETVAVARAMSDSRRSGLELVAVVGPEGAPEPITPCGRCRQVLHELAALSESDPVVLCVGKKAGGGGAEIRRVLLSTLLPHAFGPDSLV